MNSAGTVGEVPRPRRPLHGRQYSPCTPPGQSGTLPAGWVPSGAPRSPALWSAVAAVIPGELLDGAGWLLPFYTDPEKATEQGGENTVIKSISRAD